MHQNVRQRPVSIRKSSLAATGRCFSPSKPERPRASADAGRRPGRSSSSDGTAAIADDVIQEACRDDGVRVLRRFSGGGAVVLGPGCLNYAVALSLVSRPELADVAASFQFILGRIVAALGIPGLSIAGGTDLALDGRKVSGNAQRRGRRALIHHGTLLYDFDPAACDPLPEGAGPPAGIPRGPTPHASSSATFRSPAETIRARLETAWTARGESTPVGSGVLAPEFASGQDICIMAHDVPSRSHGLIS